MVEAIAINPQAYDGFRLSYWNLVMGDIRSCLNGLLLGGGEGRGGQENADSVEECISSQFQEEHI